MFANLASFLLSVTLHAASTSLHFRPTLRHPVAIISKAGYVEGRTYELLRNSVLDSVASQ